MHSTLNIALGIRDHNDLILTRTKTVHVLDRKELEARVLYIIIYIKYIVACFESGIAIDDICKHFMLPQSASFTIIEI